MLTSELYQAEFWVTYSDSAERIVEISLRPGARNNLTVEERAVFELSVLDEIGRGQRAVSFECQDNKSPIVCVVTNFNLKDQVRLTFKGLTSIGYGKRSDWVFHAKLTSSDAVIVSKTEIKVLTHIRGIKRKRMASGESVSASSTSSFSEIDFSPAALTVEQQVEVLRQQALGSIQDSINSMEDSIKSLQRQKVAINTFFENVLAMVQSTNKTPLKQDFCFCWGFWTIARCPDNVQAGLAKQGSQ